MKDLISVIIPIYNSEKYLQKCIHSVINQTYSNLEIILINDGSNDNSLKICKNINDKRIKIIDKENEGVSQTRNRGILESTGKYLMFIDSDDFIELDYIEKMYNYLIKNGCDTVVSGMTQISKNNKVIAHTKYQNENKIVSLEDLKYEILNKITFCSACKTLFTNKNLKDNNIRFKKDLKFCEDMLFSFDNLLNSKKIGYLNNCGYYYLNNISSITNNTTIEIFKDYCLNSLFAINYITKKLNYSKEDISNRLISRLNIALKKIYHLSYKEFKNNVIVYKNEYFKKNNLEEYINLRKIDYESKLNKLLMYFIKNNMYFIYYWTLKIRQILK